MKPASTPATGAASLGLTAANVSAAVPCFTTGKYSAFCDSYVA